MPAWGSTPVDPWGFPSDAVLKGVFQDREVASRARIEANPNGSGQVYRFRATVLMHAPLERSRKTLTDYAAYARLIPFVARSDYDPSRGRLFLEGGIFGWRLRSTLAFREVSPECLEFSVVEGHFQGLQGRVDFQQRSRPGGLPGTLVNLSGRVFGAQFPPAFVMERGAEIVFGVAGRRMRSYVEEHFVDEQKDPSPNRNELPSPRKQAPRLRF